MIWPKWICSTQKPDLLTIDTVIIRMMANICMPNSIQIRRRKLYNFFRYILPCLTKQNHFEMILNIDSISYGPYNQWPGQSWWNSPLHEAEFISLGSGKSRHCSLTKLHSIKSPNSGDWKVWAHLNPALALFCSHPWQVKPAMHTGDVTHAFQGWNLDLENILAWI